VATGGGVAAGGGSAEVHCTSTIPAASITASAATLRLTNVDRSRVLTASFYLHKAAAIGGLAGQVHVPLTLAQTDFRIRPTAAGCRPNPVVHVNVVNSRKERFQYNDEPIRWLLTGSQDRSRHRGFRPEANHVLF
jgi:hypothetical protein